MKKQILLIAAALCFGIAAQARSLVVLLTDSTAIYYRIDTDESPVVKFENNQLQVNAQQFAFTDILKFYVSETDDPNAIEQLVAQRLGLDMQDGVLYANTQGTVRVFATDGRQMNAPVAHGGGITAIHVENLPSGTYILQVNGRSVKFMKR